MWAARCRGSSGNLWKRQAVTVLDMKTRMLRMSVKRLSDVNINDIVHFMSQKNENVRETYR